MIDSAFLKARLPLVAICALALLFALPARGDDDPPARIGRLSDIAGQVYLSNAATQSSWAEVGMNYPVTSADDLWVGREGRAEIDFGDGYLRLAEDTNVHINRLDDRQVDVYLASGRIILSLRNMDAGELVEVFTGNARVRMLRRGVYRLDVNEDRTVTVLVVREGEAALERTGESNLVRRGETATVSGDGYSSLDLRIGVYTDAFDGWSEARDRRLDNAVGARYVSTQMIGWRDLDDHGSWHTHVTYGSVWYPRHVVAGWAPYRHGRWVWVTPWGWTWVDEAPWGFAPFHYGRWVHISGRWGWVPGRYTARPVYSPALVTFIGGNSWSFSITAPLFAWVPLGWRDPYRPYYHCSTNYVRTVNRPYIVNYTEIAHKPPRPVTAMANYRVPGAVSSVPGAAFSSGRPVRENLVNIPRRELGSAPVLASAPTVKPIAVARTSSGVNVVPASRVLKPVAPGAVRELTGAPAGGTGAAPVVVRPGAPPARLPVPSAAPSTLREGKPAAGGSGVAEAGVPSGRLAPPSVPDTAGPRRELRPLAPREAAPGSGVAPAPLLREAPASAARLPREERWATPPVPSANKPMSIPESRPAGGSGRATTPRVQEIRVAPPAGHARPAPLQNAAPMVPDKPVSAKPAPLVERRAEPRAPHQAEPGRILEGARLK